MARQAQGGAQLWHSERLAVRSCALAGAAINVALDRHYVAQRRAKGPRARRVVALSRAPPDNDIYCTCIARAVI